MLLGTLGAVVLGAVIGSALTEANKDKEIETKSTKENKIIEEEQLYDKEIKERFYQMLSHAQREIFIISPWVSERVTKQILPIFKKAVNRGVKIYIIYGIANISSEDIRNQKSKEQIQRYRRELGNALTIKKDNTHVKICICDDSYLVGSYNFLSFDGEYTTDTWHELCSYGKDTKKIQTWKQTYFNIQ